jgi:integrase/recombinase XerC
MTSTARRSLARFDQKAAFCLLGSEKEVCLEGQELRRRNPMSHYATDLLRPPQTLTTLEQKALLKASGEHARGFRDHLVFSVALGTGLRCHEITALNVGDAFHADGSPRRRFPLKVFKRSARSAAGQEIIVPDDLLLKLRKFFQYKARRGESTAPEAPLFVSQRGNRIATRSLRHVFERWQERARFERSLNFHQLRHTAITSVYRRSRDPLIAQRFARHANLRTTSVYMHASDDDMLSIIRGQPC